MNVFWIGIVHFQKFDLDLTPPFANDLALSGFWDTFDMPKYAWILMLTLPLEIPHSEESSATLILRSCSTIP